LRFKANLGKQFLRHYLKKPSQKIGLVEWLKVKALSSSPSTAKKKKKKNDV
jgi:ribosomal protein S21